MCIRDSDETVLTLSVPAANADDVGMRPPISRDEVEDLFEPVSYTHLRAHETVLDLVCRLLLEKKK